MGEPLPAVVTRKYKVECKIGEGTYGVVFKAVHRETGSIVAIKKFKEGSSANENGEGISLTACREIMLLNEINQENCVKVSDVILVPEQTLLFLVFDYAEFELYEVIKYHREKDKQIQESAIRSYLWQMLNGIYYLHMNWIIHRDLKPSNILVMGEGKEEGRVKIADFGLARIIKNPLKPLSDNGIVVTIWYRAPELLLSAHHYSYPVDIWALGCIFAELYTKKPLFPVQKKNGQTTISDYDQIHKIIQILGTPTESRWPGLSDLQSYSKIGELSKTHGIYPNNLERHLYEAHNKLRLPPKAFDLLSRMLEYDPEKRITAEEALDHPFFMEGPFTQNAFDNLSSIPYPHRKPVTT